MGLLKDLYGYLIGDIIEYKQRRKRIERYEELCSQGDMNNLKYINYVHKTIREEFNIAKH